MEVSTGAEVFHPSPCDPIPNYDHDCSSTLYTTSLDSNCRFLTYAGLLISTRHG